MNTIDDKREFIEDNDYIPDECKDCILEECDFLKDLITMLICIMIDRFGVIRDYLYERDENGEYFFGIPKGNKLEVYLLTSPEDLYEYLAEESEGFCLIAKKTPRTTAVGSSEVVAVEQKNKLSKQWNA